MRFFTAVPYGYFGIELSFGGRTGRVFTHEGPVFHWPWIEVVLISQNLMTSSRILKCRSGYGTTIKIKYTVQFRASPDICDGHGFNTFFGWKSDSGLRRIKDRIEEVLTINFKGICRESSGEDLLINAQSFELLGRCLLKLQDPPHEDQLFTSKLIRDSEVLRFYARNQKRILEVYPMNRLRPFVALIPGETNSGRYIGQSIDTNGRLGNTSFVQQLSDVERTFGIEILDFQVAVDCAPLFLIDGKVILAR